MSTQPLEQGSSLRKPSSIGEEIRRELEKRGLRAPKVERADPNGSKVTPSVEIPIQIVVKEDSLEEIDIEVKPADQVDSDGIIQEEYQTSSDVAEGAEGGEKEEPFQELVESETESQIVTQEIKPIYASDLEEAVEITDSGEAWSLDDTSPLGQSETSVDIEGEEPIDGPEATDSMLTLSIQGKAEDTGSDQPTGSMQPRSYIEFQPIDEYEETDVDLGSLLMEVERDQETSQPSDNEDRPKNIQLKEEPGEIGELAESMELPETAELIVESVDVLNPLKNLNLPVGPVSDQVDRPELMDSLLSVASHELRSPLQAISGFLELLVNKEASDIKLEEQFLGIAFRESNHLGDIITDLEAASLIEAGKLQLNTAPFHIDRLLQSCIQKFDQPEWKGQIFLEDTRIKDLPEVHADEIYMRQSLNNLFGAVLRPLPAGHHIFVRTVVEENDLIIQIASGEESPSDKPLPDAKADRNEFHDISEEGLGVFIARHIIEAHGGALLVQGCEMDGLTYTVQLPTKPRNSNRGTVLITEDNTHAALLMEYALERDGYTPIKASNGLEALEIVANDSVDLVILDVVMPGMDGFEVCMRMRSSPDTASIPVVIVSAKTGDKYRAKALRVGADAYFNKPLVLADLLATMGELLDCSKGDIPDESAESVESE